MVTHVVTRAVRRGSDGNALHYGLSPLHYGIMALHY